MNDGECTGCGGLRREGVKELRRMGEGLGKATE